MTGLASGPKVVLETTVQPARNRFLELRRANPQVVQAARSVRLEAGA